MLGRTNVRVLSAAISVFASLFPGLASCHQCAAFEDRIEYLLIYDGANKVSPHIVDVDSVFPGEAKAVSIRFRNVSKGDVRFVKAHLGCKYLDAQITKDSVRRGTETIMEFRFCGDTAPSSSVPFVQTQLEFEDRTYLTIQFKLHYQKLAGFTREDFTHTTFREDHDQGVQTTFWIPIVLSKDIALADIKPIATDTLNFVQFTLCEFEGKPFLKGVYSTTRIDEFTEVGEVRLTGKGLTQTQPLRLTLAVDGRYKFFPDVLTLQQSEENKLFTGTLMLRVQGLTSQDAISSVNFAPEVGDNSRVELVPIGKGIYRLKFRIDTQSVQDESIPIRVRHAGVRTDFNLAYRYSK